jgi:alkaline phosphatase
MTIKAIDLLRRGNGSHRGYFLMVESGRIDHAHHEGNAFRALTDTEKFDRAIGEAARHVDLRDTLIVVTADHSHVFNIAGYPLRPKNEVPYPIASHDPAYASLAGNGVLDLVYDVTLGGTAHVEPSTDGNGVPYTVLAYANGPGYRGAARVDPFPGRLGAIPTGPWDQAYFQEAAVPLGSETHAGEEVAIYAIGPGADLVRGTVKNTFVYRVMARALGF